MKHFVLLFSLLFACFCAQAQSRINYDNYQLKVSETFDYQSITELSKHWETNISPKLNKGTASYSTRQISFLPKGGIRLTATPISKKGTASYQSALLRKPLKQNYGIFRILAKIPNGSKNVLDAWPVFKLVNETTEINIFDGHADINDKLAQNINTPLLPNAKLQCGLDYDLEDFNAGWDTDTYVFQVAWTPETITFFIHGRETATVKTSELSTPIEDMELVIALQTDEASQEPFFMDIEKVDIFEHKPNTPYKYMDDYSWAFHEVSPIKLAEGINTIFPNLDNTNQVSFISENGNQYTATLIDGQWTTQKLNDKDMNLNLRRAKFKNLSSVLLEFRVLSEMEGDKTFRKTPTNGSVVRGKGLNKDYIAFIGKDDKLHFLTNGKGVYTPVEYTYGIQDPAHSEYIASKIVAAGNDIFYLSEDGRLQVFSWDYPNNKRAHWWVDDIFFTEKRLGDPTGDLARGANNQIYFRTQDGTLAYFQWEKVSQECDCTIVPVEPKQAINFTDVSLQVFPNPTADILNITFVKACSDCATQYEVLSMDGKKVLQGQFSDDVFSIDVQSLAAGTYQLNILSEKEVFSKPFTKQ